MITVGFRVCAEMMVGSCESLIYCLSSISISSPKWVMGLTRNSVTRSHTTVVYIAKKYSSKCSFKNVSTIWICTVKFSCNQRQMKNTPISRTLKETVNDESGTHYSPQHSSFFCLRKYDSVLLQIGSNWRRGVWGKWKRGIREAVFWWL